MKILLASPRGFCAGVNMAIECLNQALETFGAPIYVYHEIVHNRFVVKSFQERGVKFVDSVAEVPEGSVLLYSAHGVSPKLRKEAKAQKLKPIDATCPLVTKVHIEALSFAKQGYQIILIGHTGHDEVIGTMGEAPDRIHLVETEADVAALPFDPETKLAYLTQTTLSVDDANVLIKALKLRFPQIVGPKKEDICYATQNRQQAVKGLAKEADLVIVVGSQNSSNSQRLKELARLEGSRAHLVDTDEELQPEWFNGVETVLITAGASAPESLVQKVISAIEKRFGATTQVTTEVEEGVHFPLPKDLRQAQKQHSSL